MNNNTVILIYDSFTGQLVDEKVGELEKYKNVSEVMWIL